jgi:hypothetical protein
MSDGKRERPPRTLVVHISVRVWTTPPKPQYLLAGVVDELRLHVVPLLFGAGVRLFDAEVGAHVQLERTGVEETPNATHLTYRVLN